MTNNWNMSMKGLFDDNSSSLNRSFHEGKEVKKTEFDLSKLELLGGLGKEMTESHIN